MGQLLIYLQSVHSCLTSRVCGAGVGMGEQDSLWWWSETCVPHLCQSGCRRLLTPTSMWPGRIIHSHTAQLGNILIEVCFLRYRFINLKRIIIAGNRTPKRTMLCPAVSCALHCMTHVQLDSGKTQYV